MRSPAIAALLLAVLSTPACKSGKPLPLLGGELPPRSAERILERMLEHEVDTIRYYSARAAVTVVLPDASRSFKAHLRSVTDSAVWVSVVPALGIEVARVLMTDDSVKLLDKLGDHYFLGDEAATKNKFGLQPSLGLLQSALLGRAIGLDVQDKFRSDRENGEYVLTSREKRRFVKAAEDISPDDTLGRDMGERRLERTLRKAEEHEAIVLRYWVDPQSYHVTRVQITDLARDQSADVRYELRSDANDSFLPTRMSITLSEPGRVARATLELSRFDLEGPIDMPFRIPEKFTPMP